MPTGPIFLGRYRIVRERPYLRRDRPIAGEGEGGDLDLGLLADVHKANVLILDPGFDSKVPPWGR